MSTRCRLPFLIPMLFALTLGNEFVSRRTVAQEYDVVISGGTVYDGSNRPGKRVNVGIVGQRIAAMGDLSRARAQRTIDARGMAVAPGFINMLSWATQSLLVNGRAESDIRQGVTLEVFGEGWSYGPLNASMKKEMIRSQSDLKFAVPWTSLSEYLVHLTRRGVCVNVASFVGATTIRVHVLGYDDRRPTPREMRTMQALVRREMEAGTLGIGSSLIYAPAFYADTQELVALCKVAAEYDGLYISHMRSEGNRLLEGVDELIQIAREAGIRAEIYHLKAAGRENWSKLEKVIEKVESARRGGLHITADMYTYVAGSTGLNAAMPPWVQEGGFARWRDRLRDPKIRKRLLLEMKTPTDKWENLMLMSGSPDKVLLVGFKNPDLKHLTGKSLAEVARRRGKSPEETAMDLVIEDGSRVQTVYFLMSEENVKRKIALPWVSFGSDAGAVAPRGVFLKSNPHPRAYGCFARLLGKYVRDEKVIPLHTAIHKLTALPAANLGIAKRGEIKKGFFADVVVFDPQKINDKATFDNPHQLAVGVRDVLVNGKLVLANGEMTKARPGQVVRRARGLKRKAPPNRKKEATSQQTKARRGKVVVTDQARRIHSQGYVFDGHNDLPWAIRSNASSSFERMDISQAQGRLHTDIPRLRKGNVGAQFWSVYVPAQTARNGTALLQTLEQIELVRAMVRRYPSVFELASTTSDITRIRRAGKIASLIGVEGGHAIEDSLENLRRLHKLGARYMTLTHSDTLKWADSATDKPAHNGLSLFGEEVVREMNRLGMLVNLSHVSPSTMKDALRISKAPIIFSHSSARAVADHPRNVPDDVLRLTKTNRGVVMVNFFSGFVEPQSAIRMTRLFEVVRDLKKRFPKDEEYRREMSRWRAKNPILPGSVHDVVDHIEHIAKVAGVESVGLGSDFDGVSMLPAQLPDVASYPVITQELLNRGFRAEQIHKIMSGNVLRVMKEAEQAAKELKR